MAKTTITPSERYQLTKLMEKHREEAVKKRWTVAQMTDRCAKQLKIVVSPHQVRHLARKAMEWDDWPNAGRGSNNGIKSGESFIRLLCCVDDLAIAVHNIHNNLNDKDKVTRNTLEKVSTEIDELYKDLS